MCREKGKTEGHSNSKCSKTAQQEFKRRHDKVYALGIMWES